MARCVVGYHAAVQVDNDPDWPVRKPLKMVEETVEAYTAQTDISAAGTSRCGLHAMRIHRSMVATVRDRLSGVRIDDVPLSADTCGRNGAMRSTLRQPSSERRTLRWRQSK